MKGESQSNRWAAWAALTLLLVGVYGCWTTSAGDVYGPKDRQEDNAWAGASSQGLESANRLKGGSKSLEGSEPIINPLLTPKYAWSKEREVYHYYECVWVKKIKPENLQTGDVPPEGKRLHRGCPTKE